MPYVVTKKKLTEEQMEERNLLYDGWGKDPDGKTEYYYEEREMYNYWRSGSMTRGRRPRRGMGRGRNRDERSGQQDGSQYGWLQGGMGRNRTDNCRHPEIKKDRSE